MRWLILAAALVAGAAHAQISSAPALIAQRGTTLPTNCQVGQLFFKSDATAGQNVYGCTALNTWTAQGGSTGINITGTIAASCMLYFTDAVTGTVLCGSGAVVMNGASAPTLHAVTGSVVSTDDIQTLTNKRITRRMSGSCAVAGPGATPTTPTDSCDGMLFTALATAITSMTTNLTGTPSEGQYLQICFKDNGTARGITWGASFVASTDLALPTTTTVNKGLCTTFMYSAAIFGSKWGLINKLDNF